MPRGSSRSTRLAPSRSFVRERRTCSERSGAKRRGLSTDHAASRSGQANRLSARAVLRVTIITAMRLIGVHSTRPFHPRSRKARRISCRVIKRGSMRFRIRGASSNRAAHQAMTSPATATSQAVSGRLGRPRPRYHRPYRRRPKRPGNSILSQSSSAAGRMIRVVTRAGSASRATMASARVLPQV